MKAEIMLNTQGIRGGNLTGYKKKGAIAIDIDRLGNSIELDAYQGQGPTYQKREDTLINIKSLNGFEWSGTFNQLIEKLQKP